MVQQQETWALFTQVSNLVIEFVILNSANTMHKCITYDCMGTSAKNILNPQVLEDKLVLKYLSKK